jgi:hypothetical protein
VFGFFKKKRQEFPSAEELKRLTAAAREEVKAKWIYFNETIQLNEAVPLSQKIDFFVQPIQEFFKNKYPILLIGPTEIFWLTVFTAILESGTHSKESVNAAIEELRGKYARK